MAEQCIIEINMTDLSGRKAAVPEEFDLLGGRGLTSTIVSREVDPSCHPLGPENMLVLAPGLFAGSVLSSANRLSAGAKSPLTGGIKESNSGGMAAYRMGMLGIKAVKITGSREMPFQSLGIRISKDDITFEDLSALQGKGTYETAETLLNMYGSKCALLVIGRAGEMRLPAACITINDMEGEPCRTLGRGGLGAVMGSKGIKAIIFDDEGAESPWKGNPEVKEAVKSFAERLKGHPVTGEKFAMYGTVMTLLSVNALGGLPTRNFSSGSFEDAGNIGAETLRETIASRGGMTAHSCMPGCVIRCSNKYVDPEGNPVVGSLDFETVCLLGSNIGISSLDHIAELNRLCNDYGVDTMETGAALGVMGEAGVFGFGNFDRVKEIVQGIGNGTELGRIAGSGAETAGRVYGAARVPVVKGQGMAAYDPRAIKGMGVTYAMSPMGADHTAGNAITLAVDHLDPGVQVEPVRSLHIDTMVLDSLGVCIFTGRVSLGSKGIVEDVLKAFYGKTITLDTLRDTAKKSLYIEKLFNKQAGIGDCRDRLPDFMLKEKLPPNNSVFDVAAADMETFYRFLSEDKE